MWVLVNSGERATLLLYPFDVFSAIVDSVATSVLAYWSMSELASESAS